MNFRVGDRVKRKTLLLVLIAVFQVSLAHAESLKKPATAAGAQGAQSATRYTFLDAAEDAGTLSGQLQFCSVAELQFRDRFIDYLASQGVSSERVTIYSATFDSTRKTVFDKMLSEDRKGKKALCTREWTDQLRKMRNEYLRHFASRQEPAPMREPQTARKPSQQGV